VDCAQKQKHFTDDISEMCTVYRNRTHCRRYIRNMYCEQNQNIFQAGHQKYVTCTETEHFPEGILKSLPCTETEPYPYGTSEIYTVQRNKIFPDGTSEVCTLHRSRTLCRRYIRYMLCAQKQNIFQTVQMKEFL